MKKRKDFLDRYILTKEGGEAEDFFVYLTRKFGEFEKPEEEKEAFWRWARERQHVVRRVPQKNHVKKLQDMYLLFNGTAWRTCNRFVLQKDLRIYKVADFTEAEFDEGIREMLQLN